MADNVTTPVAANTTLATQQIGSAHFQKIRVTDDAGNPVELATEEGQGALIAAAQASVTTDAAFPITKHDTNQLERDTKCISVVTGGDIKFRHPNETTDRTITVPAGVFPIVARYIRSTGTTASGLTGY